MKKHTLFPLLAALLLLTGCAADTSNDTAAQTETAAADGLIPLDRADAALPDGVSRDGETITIQAEGTYRLTGTWEGQVTVDADGPVELVLENAALTAPEAGQAALYIASDEAVLLTLADGTENSLSDGANQADSAADATLYSEGPLTVAGSGLLTVESGANNGVQCKDALTVTGGTLTVTAANHGLKAKGALTVSGGTVAITCGGDGLCAQDGRIDGGDVTVSGDTVLSVTAGERSIDAEGAVTLSGGTLTLQSGGDGVRGGTVDVAEGVLLDVTAENDGLQAETALTVTGGVLSVTTGGGGGQASSKSGESFGPSNETDDTSASAKGLKSDGDLTVTGGTFTLNNADDSIHCVGVCTVDGGDITICSGDDALHADDMLVINGGNIDISDCFEGLEAFAVEVHGGDIVIRAVNDGINANGEETMGFPGGSSNETAETEVTSASGQSVTYFRQTGGTIDLVVTGDTNNVGDGVDSNGGVYIEGGVLTVSTRGDTQESAIDIGQSDLLITGGMVMAGGSSMMQESISQSSTQCCAVLSMDTQPAGATVTISDSDGNELWSFTMTDSFSCLILSHPDMQQGNVYIVTYGDESTTLDFTDTTVINMSGGFGMGGGMGGMGGMGGGRF